jgi:hypothetical protein
VTGGTQEGKAVREFFDSVDPIGTLACQKSREGVVLTGVWGCRTDAYGGETARDF